MSTSPSFLHNCFFLDFHEFAQGVQKAVCESFALAEREWLEDVNANLSGKKNDRPTSFLITGIPGHEN